MNLNDLIIIRMEISFSRFCAIFIFFQCWSKSVSRTLWCYGEGRHCPSTAPLNLAVCCDPLKCLGSLQFTTTFLGMPKAYMEYRCALVKRVDGVKGEDTENARQSGPLFDTSKLLQALNNLTLENINIESSTFKLEEAAQDVINVTPEYNENFHYP